MGLGIEHLEGEYGLGTLKEQVAVVPELEEGTPPKLYQYMVDTYNAMLKTAQEDHETGALIWEGRLTIYLESEVGIAQSQYSRVTGMLKKMQCIARLRRGSGRVDAQWALLGPPTYEAYEYQRKRDGYLREKRANPTEQAIKDLKRELYMARLRIDYIAKHVGLREDWDQVAYEVDTAETTRKELGFDENEVH